MESELDVSELSDYTSSAPTTPVPSKSLKDTKLNEKKKIEKVPIKLIVDKSDSKINFTHYLAIYIWLGWFNFYCILTFLLPYLFFYHKIWFSAIFGILLLSALYPINDEAQPQWAYKIFAWIISKAPEYFRFRLFAEDFDAVNESGPCIIAIEPHDVLPVSLFAYSNYFGYFPKQTKKFKGCLTSACFLVPGMRHIFVWGHATDVSKRNIKRLLNNDYSVLLCPGGAHEVAYMAASDPKEIVLYLKSRFGFIKLAAQHGLPIIPSFTFNQRDTYSFWVPKNKLLHKLGRKLGFIPMVFFGVFNIPFAPPKPCQLNVVAGKPIPVPKMEGEITKEMLKPYHDQYLEAMERLFENNKAQFDMADASLKII